MHFDSDKHMNPTPVNVRATAAPHQLSQWNETGTEYPRDKTVAQLFEQVAEARWDSVALESGEMRISYADLNARANRVAHALGGMGVKPEMLVGCCFERSVEMIVGLLGILKVGAGYVPFDPSYPLERLQFMLADTQPFVILADRSANITALDGIRQKVFYVEDLETGESTPDGNCAAAGGPTNLAYVMYTSGTTGQPKGVMVENRAIVRLVRDTNYCQFGPDEVFLQFAPVSFDAATFEIWGALTNGSKLVLMPPGRQSLEELGRVIREHRVTTLWLTSALFNLMVEQRLPDLLSIRQLLAGGDVLSPRHARLALDGLPDCRVINGYGPTENTTFTCCYEMRHGDRIPDSIPLGKPISNTQVYILDEDMNPLLAGQIGELYAAGDGLARGYWNNPQATQEKFFRNPFTDRPHQRMYRTGDLGRWREDGVIEFLGRLDGQVKIMGHRVEPEELETVLRMHKDVSQVCVVPDAGENGFNRLIAYYVPSSAAAPSSSDLRQYLAGKLPHYMIPAVFERISALPLSPNGKIDRAALPKPQAPERNSPPILRLTELESRIADLWKRILRADSVGLDDNFFDVGGDSLMVIAVHSNLQKMGIEIEITELFEFTTVRALAQRLAEQEDSDDSVVDARRAARKQRDPFERQKEKHAPPSV
jgi:amino acid adenylation domain-containing protein